MKYWIGALTLLILSGCASLSKDECINADWVMIGMEDGSVGKPLGTIGNHRKACAKINITPNLSEYESGHLKGLSRYCTAENGFALGDAGGKYNGVCSKTSEARFLQGYQAGKSRFDLRKMIEEVAIQLTKNAEHLELLHTDILDREAAIVDAGSNSRDRRHHLTALRELREEVAATEDDGKSLRYHLEALRYQLDEHIHNQRGEGFP